ncbi:hypothetical protein IFM89_025351 [Coptis chinensis]|uniref:non-specific serine/threonine protein kinase n=1 Tax=Coptis chinensis TaxID=261450 RepID=A0A835HCW1_9MAGN|nr:hypothetical protein IFM89_025351 [Coptis chinensis]
MRSRNQTWMLLSFLLLFLAPKTHFCTAADTISAGQSLIPNQTLISKDENFELGFFQPGTSPNSYIGIWYKKVSVEYKTVVWVANRDTPLTDLASFELKLSEDGNLVLLNQLKVAVWSTNITSSAMNSSEVVLGGDGNLVLRNRVKPSDVFWQSFDHPTDTWLPGGKIRYDNRTKKAQLLTSWKNINDPGTGLYSLELDPTGDQYVISRNRTQRYWTSGPWNGRIFSGVPEVRSNYIYNIRYTKNENESYFTYSLYNASIVSRFVMDVSGQLKQSSWAAYTKNWFLFWSQPRQQCDVYDFCGAFGMCDQNLPSCTCLDGFKPRTPKEWNITDYSGGCVRQTSLQCNTDEYSLLQNVKFPANQSSNQQSLAVPSASGADECKSACLNNCSCSAYAYSRGCSVWNGDLLSPQKAPDGDASGIDLYLRLAASDIPRTGAKHKGTPTPAIVGAAAGIVALLGLVFLFVWRWQTRQSVGTSKTVEGFLMAFTYRDLQNATKNFSEKLGRGGFGSVFKGTLPDSTVIAAKKLGALGQGEKQFRSEVSTIGIIQHINLIRLHGFCSEGDKRLLVYDYMPNGSLDHHMFNQQASKMLNWKVRYQIALGTARGLTYLHEKCRDCIIHCDIKPENILLDADFCPKVADFGLAKLIGREFSRVLTTMRGTRGYLAPEWIWGAAITAKADVYSYA